MITITYSENGIANADSKSLEIAKEILKKGEDYMTSTDSLIYAFRVLIKRGDISKNDIEFKYNGEKVIGEGRETPVGFADNLDNLLDELLDLKHYNIQSPGFD